MKARRVSTLLAATMLVTTPVAAMADNLGAAIVGGIIGGAIMNSQKPRQKVYVQRKSSGVSSATRAQNREVQTSLNYFGFNAGGADGVLGGRSRAAISQYQAFLGYPATGHLTEYERTFLVSSYNRAQLGGPDVIKAMQRNPQGVKGLLAVWQKEQMGGAGRQYAGHGGMGYAGLPMEVSDAVDEIAESSEPSPEQLLQRAGFIQTADLNQDGKNDYVIDTSVTGSSFWCGQTQCTTLLFASTADGYQRKQFMYQLNDTRSNHITTAAFECDYTGCKMNDPMMAAAQAPVTAPATAPAAAADAPVMASAGAAPGLSAIPMFGAAPKAQTSLASYCSKVNVLTNSNGGYVTVSTMSDPGMALNEQLCLTRTYAIARGEEMMKQVAGMTVEQVDAQCDAFGPALAPYVAALETGSPAEVAPMVQKFALSANMSIEQLQSTGAICLYSGYRRDKQDVALGSALLLVGAGQTPYAETVGHHMTQGFGTTANADKAKGWYDMAISALDNGAAPVFAPGQADRVDVLKAALSGGSEAQPMASPQPAALPTFQLKQ
ncbi:peptidoglycan-binding domain-containing protein [Pseudooceanicola onchidii]|uniref:peptidoglycan-binding domain-containing protein n=1 Tax=Pseudooceanicola onchidii TaxID=2562279 RepID=UPI0010AAED6C|nr:peptidoglycan-binding domain-containing protein [Pseudooceanicola onchidii]